MTLPDLMFWPFAVLTLWAAGVVAFSGNILRSGFSLLLCFFGVAGLYVLLGADLLAGVQVLLYVGGIVVLILFAILVTHKIRDAHVSNESRGTLSAAMLSAAVFAILASAALTFPRTPPAPAAPTTASIGNALLTKYLLPFEAVSILLLAALVGAVILVRKEVRPEEGDATVGGGLHLKEPGEQSERKEEKMGPHD